MPQYNNKTYKQ